MKYYLGIVVGCSPITLKFKTQKEVNNYLNSFFKKYGSLDDKDANWIDYLYYGKEIKIGRYEPKIGK